MNRILFLAITICFLWSCKKDAIEFQEGFIYDSGSYADDRCGYVLHISSQNYFPRNLPETITGDTINVRISIDKLDDYAFCGFGVEPLQIVNIRDIEIID